MVVEDGVQGGGVPSDRGRSIDASVARFSRRAALGQMSAGAAVGAAAWVVPQILTAKSAAGATVSHGPITKATGTPVPLASSSPPGTTGPTPASGLAFTGADLQEATGIGVAMIAAGWALHRWASRGLSEPAHAAINGSTRKSQTDSL